MIEKKYVLECDMCGDIYFSHTKKGLYNCHTVYKLVGVNPMADYLSHTEKLSKELSFCCDECAEHYFNEIEPNIKCFYKKVIK